MSDNRYHIKGCNTERGAQYPCDCSNPIKPVKSLAKTEQPVEQPMPLAKARAWPGVSRVELLQIATNAFCRYNPPGYGWDSRALEAACKAYLEAAIPEQPVDTSDIAHKLEYAFPQISLSALSDIIEYFRPYLRQPEREAGELAAANRVITEWERDMAGTLATLEAERAVAKELAVALEFYAKPENWHSPNSSSRGYHVTDQTGSMDRYHAKIGSFMHGCFVPDAGNRARDALAHYKAKGEAV